MLPGTLPSQHTTSCLTASQQYRAAFYWTKLNDKIFNKEAKLVFLCIPIVIALLTFFIARNAWVVAKNLLKMTVLFHFLVRPRCTWRQFPENKEMAGSFQPLFSRSATLYLIMADRKLRIARFFNLYILIPPRRTWRQWPDSWRPWCCTGWTSSPRAGTPESRDH